MVSIQSSLPAGLAFFVTVGIVACGDDTGQGGAGGGETQTFHVRGELKGLTDGSVTVVLDGDETLTLDANGPFEFAAPKADGSLISVEVTAQPVGFDQTCTVTPASATIEGQDAELTITCTGPTLIITEVGSCFVTGSSCWLEVHNRSDVEADLADYALRSTGRNSGPPLVDYESLELTLPSKIVPAHGYLLLRGDTSYASVDGPSVVHLREEGVAVPHWTADGFVELLYGDRTVDFVRFGNSKEAPTDLDDWVSGAAAALPSSALDYGHSLARDLAETDTDVADDWHLRAFATAGGPNDIDEDEDLDEDGLPDQAERAGGTYAGLDLFAMGAREDQRDIFVQVDWMDSDEPAVMPRLESLEKIVAVFAARGIALHFDTGPLFSEMFDPENFNLGGGNVVPFANSIVMDFSPGETTVYDYKAEYFDVRLQSVSHYLLFGLHGLSGYVGFGESPGNDMIVHMGDFVTGETEEIVAINWQASIVMHELGHNLGLGHGGDTDVNYKPNYLSTMNYLHTGGGMPVLGAPSEGQRYHMVRYIDFGIDCGVVDWAQIERGPFSPDMVIDYSDGTGAALLESAVSEPLGLGRPTSGPVDFDCDGNANSTVAIDLSNDGTLSVLTDHDDWSNLRLVFSREANGNDHGPTLGPSPRTSRVEFDPLNNDRQRVAQESPLATFVGGHHR